MLELREVPFVTSTIFATKTFWGAERGPFSFTVFNGDANKLGDAFHGVNLTVLRLFRSAV
jgi:hypothetical protein